MRPRRWKAPLFYSSWFQRVASEKVLRVHVEGLVCFFYVWTGNSTNWGKPGRTFRASSTEKPVPADATQRADQAPGTKRHTEQPRLETSRRTSETSSLRNNLPGKLERYSLWTHGTSVEAVGKRRQIVGRVQTVDGENPTGRCNAKDWELPKVLCNWTPKAKASFHAKDQSNREGVHRTFVKKPDRSWKPGATVLPTE